MISPQAARYQTLIAAGPKQIELPIALRREAAEQAERMTVDPRGVAFSAAPEVGGIWSGSAAARSGAAILYLHGGGFVSGSPGSRRKTAGHLAAAAKALALIPRYRPSPEHPFPGALDDALSAYEFLLAKGADPARTVIAGDGSGGGLAVATALAAAAKGLPGCAGLALLSPWVDLTCAADSYAIRAAADIICTRAGLAEMAGCYLAGADPQTPLASPLFAELAALPALLCVTGGDEVLLDDTIHLTRKAAIAGVDATAVIVAGMQHVFPIAAGMFPEADEAIALIADWVRARTGDGPDARNAYADG